MANRMNSSEKPKEKITPEKEIETNLAFAKRIYKDIGEFRPMVVGLADTGRYVVPFVWKEPEEKYALVEAIKEKFKSLNVTAIIFMTEAWVLKLRHTALYTKDTLPPSEHPNKEEIFILTYMNKDLYKSVIFPIMRSDGEVTLGFPETMENKGDYKIVDNLFGDYFKEEKSG